MAAQATVKISVSVIDQDGDVMDRTLLPVRFGPCGITGYHQQLSLAAGNNSIAVPSGSTLLLLELTPSAPVLTLKGANADTGIPLVPSSNPAGVAMVLPLGTSPTVIINNGGSTTYAVDATFV